MTSDVEIERALAAITATLNDQGLEVFDTKRGQSIVTDSLGCQPLLTVADGGGLVSAALEPIEGSENIARYVVELARRIPAGVSFLERTVNGQPGLVAQQDGVTATVFAFDVSRGRITRIWAVRNPDKLRYWTAR